METSRQHPANDLIDQIAHHLRQHPCDLRRVRKVMRSFHATATDMERALEQIADPPMLLINPAATEDQVLLHLLRYPEDMVDIRRVMQQWHASEGDVQRAFDKLASYIVAGSGEVRHASIDKK